MWGETLWLGVRVLSASYGQTACWGPCPQSRPGRCTCLITWSRQLWFAKSGVGRHAGGWMDEDGWRKGYTRHAWGGGRDKALEHLHTDIQTDTHPSAWRLVGWQVGEGMDWEKFCFPTDLGDAYVNLNPNPRNVLSLHILIHLKP